MKYIFGPHEKAFSEWVKEPTFPKLEKARAQIALDFIKNIDNPNFKPSLWKHQKEAIKRVIYSFEILGKTDVLLEIVTGGGKSAIMAGITAYFMIVYNQQKYLILVPNTIVRSRLDDEFNREKPTKYAYYTFPFFFNSHKFLQDRIQLQVMEPGSSPTGIRNANIILGNIHQFYEGREVLDMLKTNCGDIVIFNDEAHNSVAEKYDQVLNLLKPQRILRVDLTATPDRLDGYSPDSEKIYEYGVKEAMRDRIIKRVVVTKPDIEKVKLTYIDTETGEVKNAEEIPWEQIELRPISGSKYVISDKPMRQQLAIAKECLDYQRRNCVSNDSTGKPQWKPLLFVVALSIKDAQNITKVLQQEMGLETLLVTNESPDEKKREATELNMHISDTQYDAIVSVLMLREGWDVKNIGVICLFRKFTKKEIGGRVMSIYGQQVIGRGLRRIDPNNKDEWEQCLVVDHPILKHDWLWKLLDATELEKPLNPGDTLQPEDIPEPPAIEGNEVEIEAEKKELLPDDLNQIIDNLPEVSDEHFEVIHDWQKFLDEYQYSTEKVDIEQFIRQITKRDLVAGFNEQETNRLVIDPHKIEQIVELNIEQLQKAIDQEAIDIARDALMEFDRNPDKRQELVYRVLMDHIKKRFLLGHTVFETDDSILLKKLWFAMPEMRSEIFMKPELIEGILLHPPTLNS